MQTKGIKTSKEIGERIKEWRRKLGISQGDLAEILGVTYQQVQRYENGTNRLNVENIQVIADALSVPVSHFFEVKEASMITKKPAPYLSANGNRFLRYFRKIGNCPCIKNCPYKELIIQVAGMMQR